MAYTVKNFKTKKALKEAVDQYNKWVYTNEMANYNPIRCYQPGLGSDLSNHTGKLYLEGPHYPEPHKWYAEAWLENGIVVKVK